MVHRIVQTFRLFHQPTDNRLHCLDLVRCACDAVEGVQCGAHYVSVAAMNPGHPVNHKEDYATFLMRIQASREYDGLPCDDTAVCPFGPDVARTYIGNVLVESFVHSAYQAGTIDQPWPTIIERKPNSHLDCDDECAPEKYARCHSVCVWEETADVQYSQDGWCTFVAIATCGQIGVWAD